MPKRTKPKGRIKEAAGDLTGDKDLQREGKVDQASGKAKDAVDKAERQGQGRPQARRLACRQAMRRNEDGRLPGPEAAPADRWLLRAGHRQRSFRMSTRCG